MAGAVEPGWDSPTAENVPVRSEADDVRASDAERNAVVDLLSEHASAGRLTLAELEERVGLAYAARTRAELAALTRDLPAGSTPARRGKIARWFVAIMGGSTRRGRLRLSGHATVLSIMGGDDIDLRAAEIDGDELTITVVSIMGGSNIYVPDSVEVELTGTAIMGGNGERGSSRPPRPGAPLIRIRSFALMGGVEVWRLPAEARGMSLKEARRMAKDIERGRR